MQLRTKKPAHKFCHSEQPFLSSQCNLICCTRVRIKESRKRSFYKGAILSAWLLEAIVCDKDTNQAASKGEMQEKLLGWGKKGSYYCSSSNLLRWRNRLPPRVRIPFLTYGSGFIHKQCYMSKRRKWKITFITNIIIWIHPLFSPRFKYSLHRCTDMIVPRGKKVAHNFKCLPTKGSDCSLTTYWVRTPDSDISY
jgi:hypothetical protein